jgi:hypothetical protein
MKGPLESIALMECRPEAAPLHRASGATCTLRPLTCVSETLTYVDAGLCDSCRHQKIVKSGRGSVFSMCLRHRTDERFPKYPRLPVERCPGYERREGVSASR